MGRKQRGYAVKAKLAAVALVELVGLPAAIEELEYPHGTVHGWLKAKLRAFKRNKLGKTTKGQGRKESFPFTPALVTFMKDTRRAEENYAEWLDTYLSRKKSLENGRRELEQLLQRTADRYGFSTQKPQETKLPSVDLQQIKSEFALEFWAKYGTYSESEIYNVVKAAIQCPIRFGALKG
ncbi:LOW QUALITY PROTEIN: hypothetical protein PHMEG_00029607, partial [Phytophthora megakarya]